MKILIDTHILLWILDGGEKLTRSCREVFLHPQYKLAVSIVSLWEIAIKISTGKLEMSRGWLSDMLTLLGKNNISCLGIAPDHCLQVSRLPLHHRDPFDRMLVAQALCEKMRLMTKDRAMQSYGVDCVWE